MGAPVISKKCILLLFFFWEISIGSKKITSRDLSSVGSNKLTGCKRCKILTDSFNHWFEKTSRGKYEGGDTAWEEAKLKSYSRSEVRLVEIQEGLCSELKIHQDACYALAEEAELTLERWWFQEDPNSADLYSWLCIENLQHCCPKNHFGDECTPCPKDKSNSICSGHGKCDGDGSRKGNGTCLCKKGYSGLLCDECDKNFYLSEGGSCELCHESCKGCSGAGEQSCIACNPGWQLISGVCLDIDECSLSVCKPSEYCINSIGSYNCNKCDLSCKTCNGEGPSNCTFCESPNILWLDTCIDEELKQNLITNTFKRITFYVGLLSITLLIFHNSKSVASIVVLFLAVFIYFFEKSLSRSTVDIIIHLLPNLN